MPIPFTCPSCGLTATAPDAAAGRSVSCPRCRVPALVSLPEPLPEPEPARAFDPVFWLATISGALSAAAYLSIVLLARPLFGAALFLSLVAAARTQGRSGWALQALVGVAVVAALVGVILAHLPHEQPQFPQ